METAAEFKLHIPALGDKLVLTQPWSFRLYREHRNGPMFSWLGIDEYDHEVQKRLMDRDGDSVWGKVWLKEPVTLAAGTELIVRRIFIRLGAKGYDSVTFTAMLLPRTPPPRGRVAKPKAVRFWVKLSDANTIQCFAAGGIAR